MKEETAQERLDRLCKKWAAVLDYTSTSVEELSSIDQYRAKAMLIESQEKWVYQPKENYDTKN